MNRLSGISKTLIIILFLLAGICSFWFIGIKTVAYILSAVSFLILIIFVVYISSLKNSKQKLIEKIIQNERKVNAKILAVKTDTPGGIILQLKIDLASREYITSLIIKRTRESRENNYEVGQNIKVYVNPKDQNDIIIPEENIKEKTPKKKFNWTLLIYLPFYLFSAGLPIYLIFFDTADRKFQDISYILLKGKQNNIWEVKFQPPKKLYIYIYDPLTDETIKTIKDKKDEKLNDYMNFFISQQGQKVFIVGTGNTPSLDIYDAVNFEKLSDIKRFEQSNKKFKEGISDIQYKKSYNMINKEDIFIITTNDGEKYFYDIPKDKYYRSEKTLDDDLEEADYDKMSRQMFAFVLSSVPHSYNKCQLNVVESDNKESIKGLVQLSGMTILNVDYFNQNKKYQYKHCKLNIISGDKYYFDSKLIYADSIMAIIEHYPSVKKDAEEEVTGIDKTGKVLFNIKQNDYPNFKNMAENDFIPSRHEELKVIRNNDQIVFLYDLYGALCVDIKTGKILWKYEP